MDLSFLLVALAFAIELVVSQKPPLSDIEQEILEHMYRNSKFQAYVRPYRHLESRDPVVVTVNLHILEFDADVDDQAFEVSMYLRQEWFDQRLGFGTYGTVPEITLHDAIGFWTPDLFFVQETTGDIRAITKPNVVAKISVDGHVRLSQRITVKGSCPMDLRRYPVDTQTCRLRIESYAYASKDLILEWKSEDEFPAVDGSANAPGYDVSYTRAERTVQFGGDEYKALELEFKLERRFSEHFFHVYVPVSFFVFASWIPFWMDPSCHVIRFLVSLTSIFSALLQLNTNGHLFVSPGYVTALDAWVSVSGALLFAAFFENVFVAYATGRRSKTAEHSERMSKRGTFLSPLLTQLTLKIDFFARALCPAVFVLSHFILFFM